MTRKEQWPTLMWEKIEQYLETPFVWGENDCCLFTARVVDAITGGDFEEQLKPHYHDKASAIKYIGDSGGLESAVSTYFGPSKTGRPQRGDVVMFDGPLGHTIGICVGNKIASVYDDGVCYVNKSQTICFWSI